jgi:FkbH-like protein
MYQNEAKRKQELESSLNLDDYIAKLEMVADIHRMRDTELERVVQLINKTNQFNVTTKRYTQAEVEEIAADPNNAIYVVYSSDKYGDSGLISVIILIGSEVDVRIDTFLMSCRVMGRKLEDVILNELAAKYQRKMIGEFIPTAKNAPVRELFDRLGFSQVSDDNGHKVYELDGTGYEKKEFGSYREIRFED